MEATGNNGQLKMYQWKSEWERQYKLERYSLYITIFNNKAIKALNSKALLKGDIVKPD